MGQQGAAQHPYRGADRHRNPHHGKHARQLIAVEPVANGGLSAYGAHRRAKRRQHPCRQQQGKASAEDGDDRRQQIQRQTGQNGGAPADHVTQTAPNDYPECKSEKVTGQGLRRGLRADVKTVGNMRERRAIDRFHNLGKHHHQCRQGKGQSALHGTSRLQKESRPQSSTFPTLTITI
ncbi:hypothetical protein D3C79_823210 [compost metagenome]